MDIENIKDANARAGYFYFSPDTMRFWHSRVSENTYESADGKRTYLVTSDKPGRDPRAYTVRVFDHETKAVESVSGFGEYASASGAHKRAQREARA